MIKDILIFRILKIFLTVSSCLAVGEALNISDQLTMVFVTLLCLTSTVLSGIRIGIQQLTVAAFCSMLTIFFLHFIPEKNLAAPAALIIPSFIIIYRREEYLLPIVFFSVLYIALLHGSTPESLFFQRIFHLLIGIPIAAIFNFTFGVYNYRTRLYKKIVQMRKIILLKCAELYDALSSENILIIERQLADLDNKYIDIAALVDTIKDIEKEHNSIFSFAFKKINNIQIYKYYVWNIHDLLQNIHNVLTFGFKINARDKFSGYTDSVSAILRDSAEKKISKKIETLAEFYSSELKQYSGNDLFFAGNLYSSLVHLKKISEYENILFLPGLDSDYTNAAYAKHPHTGRVL